jgi:hypothetical protein
MKQLVQIFAFIILGFVLIAGCTTQPPSTSEKTSPTISTTSPSQAISIQVSPTETVDTLCGELVYCGYAPSGFKTQSIKSDRCTQLGTLRQQNDQKVMACLKNPYEASGNNAVAELHCRQGVGTVEDCARYGVKLDRDNGNVIP